MSSKDVHFPHPWPAPQRLWADPPWELAGTSTTAWFEIDLNFVKQLVSSSFNPLCGDKGVITRLRFYDIKFEPRDGSPEYKKQLSGGFKEAVLAFKGAFGDIDGEYSAFMWTDDDIYIGWGRENFGWPLIREEITLQGPAWSNNDSSSTKCTVKSKDFELSLNMNDESAREETLGKGPNWLTPRRVIFPAGDEPDRHDLNVVRPSIINAGKFYVHQGSVSLDIKPGSILDGLAPLTDVVIHRHADFKICVGDNVETIKGHA